VSHALEARVLGWVSYIIRLQHEEGKQEAGLGRDWIENEKRNHKLAPIKAFLGNKFRT